MADDDIVLRGLSAPFDFLERRASVVERLLSGDPFSLDAIALAVIALDVLARRRFPEVRGTGANVVGNEESTTY